MKIGLLSIVSTLHDQIYIDEQTKLFIGDIENRINQKIDLITIDQKDQYDLILIFVQSGGSENYFKEMYKDLEEPYLLLTYGTNNSLAASMEILSFIQRNNMKGEILHGSVDYISKRIIEHTKKIISLDSRLGVIGHPSDWLISSDVDYEQVKNKLGVELVNIPISKVVESYNNISLKDYINVNFEYKEEEVNKAKRVYLALKKIKDEYNLNGLTIRCFDLLGSLKTTSCLGLALLNDENITSTCEGDIPTMLSMHICNHLFSNPGFQANPSRIDLDNGNIVFAHCTIPLNMVSKYYVTSHYESKIGAAIKGELSLGPVTIFKLGADLKTYFVEEGEIIENLNDPNLCRTQIRIKMNSLESFLTHPVGNHHVIIYGHHKQEIIDFLK